MNTNDLKAGTRVTTAVGRYAGQVGTVLEGNRGTVTNTEHENYGRAYVSVRWDPTPEIPWGETFRPFADELTVVGEPKPSPLSTLEDVELPTDEADREDARRAAAGLGIVRTPACKHGNTPRPDVTGDPIKACANAASTTEWGAFNAEGCTYAYDCAVDVANESAKENEEAEATSDDPESRWGEMCREHRDQEQPKDGCEECFADEGDESECEGHYDDDRALTLGEPYYCDGSCNPR